MTSFNNNSDQRERARILANDRATMHRFAQSEAGEVQGRWAKPAQVTGSEGAVHMPRLPANSPWAAPDPSGQEAPYPIDLSEPPEPVGTAQEIEDSLQPFSWDRSNAPSSCSPEGIGADGTVTSPASSCPASSPTSLSKTSTVSEKEGGGNTNGGREGPSPSRSNIKRRLV